MDFKPFAPPPTDHHGLATGLTTEGGVSAKGFVEGVNSYFEHLFGMIGGKKADEAERITELEEALATAQRRGDALDDHVKALLASYDKLEGRIVAIENAPKPEPVAEKTS